MAESWENFITIVSRSENIPVVEMLFLGLGILEGGRNDELVKSGRRDQALIDMQR